MRIARMGQLLLVGWLLLCVGLIVPAHNGAHSHEHAHSETGESHSHALSHEHDHDPHPGDDSDHADDAGHCSICQFAAGLTQPQPVDVNVQPPRLIEILTSAEPVSPASRQVILPFHGRAPPIGA